MIYISLFQSIVIIDRYVIKSSSIYCMVSCCISSIFSLYGCLFIYRKYIKSAQWWYKDIKDRYVLSMYTYISYCDNIIMIHSIVGIGTRAWGDKAYWNYDPSQDKKLQEVFNYCMEKVRHHHHPSS